MKKILISLLFAFCVLTVYSSNVESVNIIYMNETFKDDTAGQPPANWTSNGEYTTFEVASAPTKCSGGKCLHLVDGSGGAQAEYTSQMWNNVSTDVRQFNISFMINITTFSQNNFNVLNTPCYRIDFRNRTSPFGVQIFNKSESAFTPSGFNGIESRGYEVDIMIDRDTNLSHTRVNDGGTTVSADGTIDGTCDVFSTFVGSVEGVTSGASDYYLDDIVVFSEAGEVNSTKNVTSPHNNQWYPSSPVNLSFDSNTTFNVTYNLNAGNNVSFCTNCNNKSSNELSTNEGKNNITIYFEDGSAVTELFREYYVGLSIALCSDPVLSTPTANFTFRLESNNTVVNATSNGLFTSTLNSSSAFSSGFGESDSIELCTHPNVTSMTSQTLIDYENTGFVSRQFNGFQSLTNVTQFFDLFMLESGSSEAIVITVQDSNSKLLEGRFVEAHRFFVANNTFKLVDSGLTDVNGITELDLDSGSNIEYKFIVKNGNTVELETGRITLTTNTLTLTVLTGLEKTLEILNNLRDNVISTLSFDEGSSVVTLTYTDSNNVISNACLNLFNKTSQHQVFLGGNCSTSDSDTLTLSVPLINISYIAYFDAIAIEDGNNYTLNSLDIDLNKDFETWGSFGLFLAFVLFLIIMGVVEDPIGKVVSAMFSFGFFKLSGIFAVKNSIFWGVQFILAWGIFLMYKRRRGS